MLVELKLSKIKSHTYLCMYSWILLCEYCLFKEQFHSGRGGCLHCIVVNVQNSNIICNIPSHHKVLWSPAHWASKLIPPLKVKPQWSSRIKLFLPNSITLQNFFLALCLQAPSESCDLTPCSHLRFVKTSKYYDGETNQAVPWPQVFSVTWKRCLCPLWHHTRVICSTECDLTHFLKSKPSKWLSVHFSADRIDTYYGSENILHNFEPLNMYKYSSSFCNWHMRTATSTNEQVNNCDQPEAKPELSPCSFQQLAALAALPFQKCWSCAWRADLLWVQQKRSSPMSHPRCFSQRLSHTPLRGDGSAAVQYELSSHRIISSQDSSAWLHMNYRSRGSQWASVS